MAADIDVARRGGLLVPLDAPVQRENDWTQRGGLLIPLDLAVVPDDQDEDDQDEDEFLDDVEDTDVVEPWRDPTVVAAARQAAVAAAAREVDLDARRQIAEVEASDEIRTLAATAEYARQRDAIEADQRRTTAVARSHQADLDMRDEVAELYRRTIRIGTAADIRARIRSSAEVRAERVDRVRRWVLLGGGCILAAFAAWSTSGVHDGVVVSLGLKHRSASWWAAWAMEPALMTIVAMLIIARAALSTSGGGMDRRADVIQRTALATSLGLNIIGGWSGAVSDWTSWRAALVHSIGPIGAAGTAYMMALVEEYCTSARPWEGAPRLAEMGLTIDRPIAEEPPAVVVAAPSVAALSSVGNVPRTGTRTGSTQRKPRPNPGFAARVEAVRQAIRDGRIPVDPNGNTIHTVVMGRSGSREAAYRLATAVHGWTPEPESALAVTS